MVLSKDGVPGLWWAWRSSTGQLCRLVRVGELFEEVDGEGCGEDGAVFLLLDLDRVDEVVEGCVVWIAGGLAGADILLEALEGAEEVDEGGEGGGRTGCVVFGGEDLVDAKVELAGVAGAGDEGGVLGHGELETESGDVAVLGEGKADVADGPGAREERDVAVAGFEERGASEGAGAGAEAVEDGVDLLGGGHVGGGDGVVAELGDAEEADGVRGWLAGLAGGGRGDLEGDGDGVDVVAGIGLAGGGDLAKVAGEACAVEAALEDLGVGDGAVGAGGVVHAMEGEGGCVEVALEDDAGGVDEALVVGASHDRGLLEVGRQAQRFQVEVDDCVGLREQPGDLGRRLLAQEKSDDQS